MFERLAGKLLSRLLSKYFVSDDSVSSSTSSSSSSSWSNSGVWSGYVSLESLQLRKEVVNSYLKSKGLPFELLQCTLGRVEITVPWAKLGLSSAPSDGEDAVVVTVVVDGVHALLRTNYEFDDDVLREAAIRERRQELLDAGEFGKEPEASSYSSNMAGFLQKRIAEGILKEILEKLHIHVRDVHIRLEDIQSDPINPCAVGVTFESLHVQADDVVVDSNNNMVPSQNDETASGVIRKVAQLNHFAVYWNALDYGEGLPTEMSVLQDTLVMEPAASVASALDRCIARRATSLSSPVRASPARWATPNHSFLLLPLDASWKTKLSTDPHNLEERPALETSLQVDDLSLQLRDFQCSQISILASAVKEHSFSTNYRKYRPSVSAKENPRAWWKYAFRIVRMELHKGNMRWSWSRFSQRYALRKRYCELYERERRFQVQREQPRSSIRASTVATSSSLPVVESMSSLPSQDSVSELSSSVVPDEGTDISNGTHEALPLTEAEIDELTAMEDGTLGDLSVHDIVLFRALVNARHRADKVTSSSPTKSRFRSLMSSFINDDIESEEEYERLLAYLEQARDTQESLVSPERASSVAVSIHVNLGRGCISLFSPLRSTEDLNQHRRIQQRFLDLTLMRFHLGYSLFGNYESTQVQASLADIIGSEIRSNHSVYTIVSRTSSDVGLGSVENGSSPGTPQTSNVHAEKQDLATFELQGSPIDSSDCDIRINASLRETEILLLPDGEWFQKLNKLASSKRTMRSLSSFWEDMGMVQINLLSSRKAGLLAKANTALFAHKNVDMDILIRCPLLRVSDGRETSLAIDLGHAHFVTERLAGVATGKLLISKMKRLGGSSYLRVEENGNTEARESTEVGSTDSSGKLTPKLNGSDFDPSSPRRELGDSFFLGGSAMSVIGGNRMSTRSFYGNVPFVDDEGSEDFPSKVNRGLDSSFYDEFRLEISNTRVFLSCGDGFGRSSLVDNMETRISVSKSVIPSDHTLCRLKTQCAIRDVNLRLSEASVSRVVALARNWMEAVATKGPAPSFYRPSVSVREGRMDLRLGLPALRDTRDQDFTEAFSDASSMLDEAEFMDALEGDDTDDATGAWFDDNWIADAESVVDSDVRSVSQRRRSRRKASIMSDVSSISDRSLGTRRVPAHNQYLSAENLAKLEELVAEDEDGGSDADSFQSALSIGGQAALAAEVEEHIRRAEDEVKSLKSRLTGEAKYSDGSPFLIPEARRRSQVRKGLRVDLERARAELSALRATHEDLLSQLEAAEALHYDEKLEADQIVPDGAQEGNVPLASELNARAMALVRARKHRSLSNADEGFKHQLTSGLNRELLRASFIVSKVTVVVEGLHNASVGSDQRQGPSGFELCMSQCALGFLSKAKESRISASVDGIYASMVGGVDEKGSQQRQHILLGGSNPLVLDSSREGYDVPMAPAEDRVLILTIDRQEKPVSGRSLPCTAQATKVRIHVGEIEVVPREESLSTLSKFVRNTSSALPVPKKAESRASGDKESVSLLQKLCRMMNGARATEHQSTSKVGREGKVEYSDLSFRLSSLRVALSAGDNTIGSFLFTEVGGRFLRGATHAVSTHRSQLDLRCKNVQLFDLYRRSSGLELLGCRDPYNPVAQLRIRSQLVPLTQTGGWVVGDKSEVVTEGPALDDLVWNMHIGAKLNSVFATLSPEGLQRVKRSSQTLIGILKSSADRGDATELPSLHNKLDAPALTSVADSQQNPLRPVDSSAEASIRWRLDFVAKKVSVLFPSAPDISEIETSHPHLTKGNALLSFSLHSWMQAAPRRVDSLLVRSSLSDISLVRTSDDWPLLESTSMVSEIILSQRKIVNSSCLLRLSVPDTFSWSGNRSLSVGGRADELNLDDLDVLDRAATVLISIAPLRFNITAQTGSLLIAVVDCFKGLSDKDKRETPSSEGQVDAASTLSSELQADERFFKVSAELFEVKLLRESERSTSISFADPLASLVAVQVAGSASRDVSGDSASIGIQDLCLYDLSSLPGARVFGLEVGETRAHATDICGEQNGDSDEIPQIMQFHATRSYDESASINLDTRLGKIHCLVIPSFLQSLLSFRNAMGALATKQVASRVEEKPLPQEKEGSELTVPFGVQKLGFSLRMIGLECLLPSRDLFSYIRSRSKDPVNVVAFRLRSSLTGEISCPSHNIDVSLLDSLSLPAGQDPEVACVMAQATFSVEEFQVLRTNIRRRPFPRSAAGGPHISPCSFMVDPPIAGEQRITNPFWFRASYQFAVVTDRPHVPVGGVDTDQSNGVLYHASQALQVDAGFVDILVYIKQSEGGMNDAVRVTVRPILDMLKQKDEPGVKKDRKAQTNTEPSKFSQSLKSATTVCSLQSRGIQVTCVPGGATRLTESPIAKCELSHLKLALVGVALPVDPKVAFGPTSHMSTMERLRQAGLERIGVVEPAASGGPVSHMTLGGWVQAELSASYHNRRLVAWEPFIEPWVLNVRSGIDLVRAFKCSPSPWLGESDVDSHSGGFIGVNEKAGERIRDIGRLLRSPFSPSGPVSVGKSADEVMASRAEMSPSNLSYVMMKSISPKVVGSALYPTGRAHNANATVDVPAQMSSLQCLPGTSPARWLELFGHPSIGSHVEKRDPAAMVCSISDSSPLNVNLTGALIENVIGFLGGGNRESIHPAAPHMIRNFSGLTIRFQECLDTEQIGRGELAKKTIVSTGSEIPLSLKRSLSQSCDPHRAYIYLELGNFEDTAGRINPNDFEVTSRSRSTTFFYKATGKIPVDTVGVRKYALCHTYKKRTERGEDAASMHQDIGYIIVRVDLQGSTKLVSIESPLVLKNNAELDLLCELRNHGGVSLLWRSLVPKASTPMPSEKIGMVKRKYISVPADLVSTASDADATLSVRALSVHSSIEHESDVPRESGDQLVAVDVPPPFSDKSVARGLIKVFETSLGSSTSQTGSVNLSTCAVRIGSVSLQKAPESAVESATSIVKQAMVPEQRMLFFRPPIVIRNHLPLTISVQGRVKMALSVLRRTSSAAFGFAERINLSDSGADNDGLSSAEWHDLGILECGRSLSWTGATATEEVEIRVRVTNTVGESSRKFPEWSTCTIIPSQTNVDRLKKPGVSHSVNIGQMTVCDDASTKLQLSASLEFGSNASDTDSKPRQDVCWFSRTLPPAPRVVGVFVPFWVIDSTGQDLEFSSSSAIAGQSSRCSQDSLGRSLEWNQARQETCEDLGLAELLDDDKLRLLSAKASFEVLMVGDQKSSRLSMRRRMTRMYDNDSGVSSNWCDPVSLRERDNTFTEVFVPAPSVHSIGDGGITSGGPDLKPLALGARILAAPEEFGGVHGTKLLHISCRYRIVNEMGREIEVLSEYGRGRPSCIGIDGSAVPFHFDGSSPIRFRPKEFGWCWSGRFSIRKKRKEVTLRLVHKLKGQVIIAEVEFVKAGKSGGNVLVFREASHPPFRLENQTMQALHFSQSSVLFGAERGQLPVSLDSTILPYHHADFAWDEPDGGRRSLAVEVADLGNTSRRHLIGRFKLDRVVPGNRVRLSDSDYFGQVVADGPTRVLRITDSSLPLLPANEVAVEVSREIFAKSESSAGPPSLIELKLTHGLGISVVDWAPQELMYIKLDEIVAERRVDETQETVALSVGCVSVDNQMWVTPFPVLMRMGRRTRTTEKVRRRKNTALSASWRRALNTQSGLTLLNSFELSAEPVILCVDGYLSERLWSMAKQVSGMRDLTSGTPSVAPTRDSELRKVLQITEERHANVTSRSGQGFWASVRGEGEDEAFLATAAVAAKLRMRPRSESVGMIRPSHASMSKQSDAQSSLLNQRNKFYLGKWKISTLQSEISWSGPLPGVLIKFPDIMRPALTFESLPVMMRPFSISHAYGTADDLVHDLKSHYLSIWRVLDVLVGLTFRPTFMIRACIYTTRETCASVFDSISNALGDIEKSLVRLSEPQRNPSPPADRLALVLRASQAYQTVVGGSLLASAALFRNSAHMTLAVSNALRYGGSARNPASRSVRARNPRLFAHVEGQELLVEYVEGENAGKAILSRVRMGRHLGEGHVFHCEGVHLQADTKSQAAELDSASLICMVTSERVFLLNGDRHEKFCSVVWESTFMNLVEVEYDEFAETTFDLVKLWYLVDTAHAKGNKDDRLARYAKGMASDADFGLDILLCKTLFVPRECGAILRSKISAVHRRLDEAGAVDIQRI